MKKKIILLFISFLISSTTVYATSFEFDASKSIFTNNNKRNNVINNFEKKYAIESPTSIKDKNLEKDIINLTKKTTYLLFGGFNNTKETSENYYKRHKEWLELRYNPKVPEDKNNPLGLDTNSQEYKDDLVSGLALPQIFNQANELGLVYNSYGDIRITDNNDIIISSVILPNVKIKKEDENNPMNYKYIKTNYIMNYYYKKLNNEWKLYNLYGETVDEILNYFNEIETKESKQMAIAPTYKTKMENIYNFDKLNKVTTKELSNIYKTNINNTVFLNGYYDNSLVASSNGFFIDKNLIITTWNFVEQSLIKAQYITAKSNNKELSIIGIVTANLDNDIAIIKVKENNSNKIKLGNHKKLKVEDPVFTISSKIGTGSLMQKGIIVSNTDYINTSIPLSQTDEGSMLLNSKGEVIGMNTSKSINNSMSLAVNSETLNNIQSNFTSKDSEKIDAISFEELKEKYYYTEQSKAKIVNNIPKSKWKTYSKIGDIENTIKQKPIKANYKNGVVSLKYKNNLSKYIKSMQLSNSFKNELIKEGYKEILNTNTKAIYKNKKYQVVIMESFDNLIIVMVKL